MNLDQITTKCWILALFERDDGERLLLGDGWFDFKDSLQHFQPNTFANDVIELQGSDGQMLAGQVRRGAPQSFDGYIGDPITNRQTIEQHRREFLMFFRKRHHYKVVYIFPDGTAIQRKQGYITDAPSVPEIRQRFPEYHVALNFEDVNYYEYAENAQGEEIFSNIRNINISTAATGGLVWDNLGAVSDQMGWKDIATATGQMLAMTNPESIKAPIASFEMTGSATQSGTPTPSAPVPVQTVTGRQTVGIVGKNLFDKDNANILDGYVSNSAIVATNNDYTIWIPCEPNATYTIQKMNANPQATTRFRVATTQDEPILGRGIIQSTFWNPGDGSATNVHTITTASNSHYLVVNIMNKTATTTLAQMLASIQIEKGSTATTYEPYEGQNYEINLGKNLIEPLMPTKAYHGVTCTNNGDGSFTLNGTATATATWRIEQSTANGHDHLRTLNGTYTLSCKGVQAGVSLVVTQLNVWQTIGKVQNNETPSTFTSNLNDTLVYIAVTNGTTVNNVTVYPQLEKGSIASSYSPHFEPIELCKENGKWWLHKEIGKIAFTSSTAWSKHGTTAGNIFMLSDTGFIGYPYNSGHVTPALMDTDRAIELGTMPDSANGVFGVNTGSQIRVFRGAYDASYTADMFKAEMVGHYIYGALTTPTTTEITNEAVLEGLNSAAGLKLFPGQNNITDQTPNAQPTMTVQYYTALGPGGGLVWESGEAGGATIIEASGLDSAFPLWTVPGPSTNPTLTNITTGQSITWQGTVPAGQTLEIDMDKQTATLAGANVYAFVSGDWIRIDPGPNRITYVGTGATQASTLSWNNIVG